jgi:hypothetical protein
MKPLNTYEGYVKVFIRAETSEDAIDTLTTAIDASNFLDQDGIFGVDIDFVEDSNEEELDNEDYSR